MKILLGKNDGVCFGVKRALDEANQALEENNKIYCLGELVHNKCITKRHLMKKPYKKLKKN